METTTSVCALLLLLGDIHKHGEEDGAGRYHTALGESMVVPVKKKDVMHFA